MAIDETLVPELCGLKWPKGNQVPLSWTQLEKRVGQSRGQFRTQLRTYKDTHPDEFEDRAPSLVGSQGLSPTLHWPDEDEAFERACDEWAKTERIMKIQQDQYLRFDHGPIGLAWTADWHLGHRGVDYPRLDHDLRLVADTPGMWAIGGGDLLDQMIIGSLINCQLFGQLTILDEWALARRMLKLIAHKLLVVVLGNHDNWLEQMTGVSYFEHVLRDIQPRMIFDTDDSRFEVQIGDWKVPFRVRHQWRGSSIYNATHGIERAVKWDHDFVVGLGAHTHAGGLTRSFCIDGQTGLAMMAGTYTRWDEYARRKGFAHPNASATVAVVIDDRNHSLTGFDNLQACADYMEALY